MIVGFKEKEIKQNEKDISKLFAGTLKDHFVDTGEEVSIFDLTESK